MAQSLKQKTIKGTAWSAAEAFLSHGIVFVVSIVLARLLSPSDYGLLGLCTIFVTILDGIVDSGFGSALIRKKDATNDDYNTMFITNMVFSVALYFVLFFSAPLIAQFFKRMEMISLLRVTGLIVFIHALSITQYTILAKRLDFKSKTKATAISGVVSGVIGIVMALAGFGVWALVGQHISKRLVNTICFWVINRWKPSLRFNKESFRYMWGFGWKIMLSGLLNNIWNQLYQVVVGRWYSPQVLGQYTQAKNYSNVLSLNFTLVIQRVTYPALSKTQDDKPRMVTAYRRVIKLTMFVTAICMISMGAVAEPLIYCMIGEKWHMAATFLPLICISCSLYPLHAINLNMLNIQGRSDIYLYLEIVKKVLAVIPIAFGIFVSIYWMLIGSIIMGIISFFLNSYYTGKSLNYSSWMQIKDVAPSYGIAFAIGLCVYFLKYLPLSNYYILAIQIVVGVAVFFVLCKTFKIKEYQEIKSIIIGFLKKENKEKSQNNQDNNNLSTSIYNEQL